MVVVEIPIRIGIFVKVAKEAGAGALMRLPIMKLGKLAAMFTTSKSWCYERASSRVGFMHRVQAKSCERANHGV